MTDKWDWVPNDYKPNCLSCEAVSVCPFPQQFVDMLTVYMAGDALANALEGKSIPNVYALAEISISRMEGIIKNSVSESSQSKVLNFLRFMNFVAMQANNGDTTMQDKIKELGGE